jgi:hypothetical protein
VTRRQCIKAILLSEARRNPPENRTAFDELANEVFSALPGDLSDEIDRLGMTNSAEGLVKLASAAWNEYRKLPRAAALEVSAPRSRSLLKRKSVMVDYLVECRELWTREGNLAYTVYYRICRLDRCSHICVSAPTLEETRVWAEKVLDGEMVEREILDVVKGDCEEVLL